MNTRHWLVIGLALVVLVGLLVSPPAPTASAPLLAAQQHPPALLDAGAAPDRARSAHQALGMESENYHLVAAGIGSIPAEMESNSYAVNQGITLLAQVALPMQSENYRAGGVVPQKTYLPLVLRNSGG
jgi:hypothetical protein